MTTPGKFGVVIVQAGGATAVMNASAAGLLEAAQRQADRIGFIYGAHGGLAGLLSEELFDLGQEEPATLAALPLRPAAAFGTAPFCPRTEEEAERALAVLRAHEARCLFVLGDLEALEAAARIQELAIRVGCELAVIGVPQAIENDIAGTDHSLGYGSAARLAALATLETGLDNEDRPRKESALVLETLGRNTGWIAAATGVGRRTPEDPPHLIYVPEAPVSLSRILEDARAVYQDLGRLFVVAAEGCVDEEGRYISESGGLFARDETGRARLGGIAETLRLLLEQELSVKCRTLRLGVWQRCAAALASATDLAEARAAGAAALEQALSGASGVMIALSRESEAPYRSGLKPVALGEVVARSNRLPRQFLNERGNFISPRMRDYALPLMAGRDQPAGGGDGLPYYARLRQVRVAPRAGPWGPT
jgi:6-phosphofructokinase 1